MPITPKDKTLERQKPDLPEETLQIMERLVRTPPAPHDSDRFKKSQAQKKKAKPVKASASSSSKR